MANNQHPKRKDESVPKWIVISGAVLALLASLGAAVNYGGALYRVPFATEALDKRVTKVETAVESITSRLSAIESNQRAAAVGQDASQRTLLEVAATIKTMSETMLNTWKKSVELEERVKSFQGYTDERLSAMDARQRELHNQPTRPTP